jgi:hypothetical protein
VRIYDAAGNWVDGAERTTDANGRYRVAGLPDGVYYVAVSAEDDAFSDTLQIYPGTTCADDECAPLSDGEPIAITNSAAVDGIDFTFHPDMVVEGRVTDAASGAGIARMHVVATSSYAPVADTATDGRYRFYASRERGPIRVYTRDSQPHIDQVYPAIPCILSDCLSQGEILPAASGAVYRNVDFVLSLGASIAGHVNTTAFVYLYDASFSLVWVGGNDEHGEYASAAWLPGTYYAKVFASTSTAMVCAFYDARPCPPDGVDPGTVMPTPIALSLGEVRSGIDFAIREDAIYASGFDF